MIRNVRVNNFSRAIPSIQVPTIDVLLTGTGTDRLSGRFESRLQKKRQRNTSTLGRVIRPNVISVISSCY